MKFLGYVLASTLLAAGTASAQVASATPFLVPSFVAPPSSAIPAAAALALAAPDPALAAEPAPAADPAAGADPGAGGGGGGARLRPSRSRMRRGPRSVFSKITISSCMVDSL
jgi:hypothetical protein